MTRTYSLDLRERVVEAVEEGSSARGAADHFKYGDMIHIPPMLDSTAS